MGSCPGFFKNLVDNPLTFTIKFSARYLTYIRRLTYLERLELGVIIFLNIAMFVVKITDLIPKIHRSTGDFSRNNAPMMGFDISNKTSAGEDDLRV